MTSSSSSSARDLSPMGPPDGPLGTGEAVITVGEEKPSGWPLPLGRISKYLVLAVGANTLLWLGSLNYLKKTPPTYTSELVIHVAGNAQGVNVNLPGVGQAMTSSTSAFGSSSDPRENYKLLLLGEQVLSEAAQDLAMKPEDFGKPKIDLIPNTTTLRISQTGLSPAIAQEKALALYQTLDRRLNTLRQTEQEKRDAAITEAVTEAQTKLTQAQSQLSAYKARSGLTSSEQITNLIATIETLRKQRAEQVAQTQQLGDRLGSLSRSVELSPDQAATALVVQTDQPLQKSLEAYTQVTTALNALLEERGPNYPDVVELRQQQTAALDTVMERGRTLLGPSVTLGEIQRLNLDNSNSSGVKRGELFQQLVTLQAEYQGLRTQVQTLTEQIKELESRLKILVQKESVLDNYVRKLQIAEAVFTSTLAKVDLGKSDPFGSFPLVQLVEPPTLPTDPTAPKKKLVLLGAAIGSLLVTFGLTLLWWRNAIVALLTKLSRQLLA